MDRCTHHCLLATCAGPYAPSHGNVIDTDDAFRVVGGAAVLDELTATPAAPADGTQATVYVKGDKLVVAYKEGATMRYKSLQISGSGSTWPHSTTAP